VSAPNQLDSIESIVGILRLRGAGITQPTIEAAFGKYTDLELAKFLLHYGAQLLAEYES
jgi:hypothetical protein